MEAILEHESLSEVYGSCIFMNLTGDITIVWDEQNREKILEIIKKKMEEGYTFFTTKKYMFGKIKRKSTITDRDIRRGKIEDIIITDKQFDKMIQDMDDRDLVMLVKTNVAEVAKRKDKDQLQALERAKKPEDVIDKDSLAVRPLKGG